MLTMPQVPACRLFMTLRLGGGSQPLQRRSGQLPSAFGHSGAITDLERAALGIAPIQKISVCAAILRLHRIKLCLLIAPLWGVSEEGGHGAYHHSPYFWDNVLESRQALPHSPLWPRRFRASVAQGRGWHRWGCARLTLLSQPPPRSACSVQ